RWGDAAEMANALRGAWNNLSEHVLPDLSELDVPPPAGNDERSEGPNRGESVGPPTDVLTGAADASPSPPSAIERLRRAATRTTTGALVASEHAQRHAGQGRTFVRGAVVFAGTFALIAATIGGIRYSRLRRNVLSDPRTSEAAQSRSVSTELLTAKPEA